MKKRLISLAFALLLLAVVIIFFDTIFLNLVIFAVSALAIFEIYRAYNVPWWYVGVLLPLALVVFYAPFVFANAAFIIILYMILTFLLAMLVKEPHIPFANAAAVTLETVFITFALGCLIMIRDVFSTSSAELILEFGLPVGTAQVASFATGRTDAVMIGVFSMWLAWIGDTFAYCFGKRFGKRKLAPKISPNKTVAGAIGAVFGTPVFVVLYFAVYSAFSDPDSMFHSLGIAQYIFFVLLGLVGGFLGMYGDLAQSYIKREVGIKDFGNLMPGHGGALDRIDSPLFTIPLAYFAFLLYRNIF